MGWIPAQAFSLGSTKPKPAADHVEEPAGHEGEWVTLVNRSAITKQPIRYKRRGRPILETKTEAVSVAKQAIKNGEKWQ
jgi:hypothetical protein